jgi:hypothetical protein
MRLFGYIIVKEKHLEDMVYVLKKSQALLDAYSELTLALARRVSELQDQGGGERANVVGVVNRTDEAIWVAVCRMRGDGILAHVTTEEDDLNIRKVEVPPHELMVVEVQEAEEKGNERTGGNE